MAVNNYNSETVLRNPDITKIYLSYLDKGKKYKYETQVRFVDNKECYFSIQTPTDFTKPQKRIPVEVVVYTPDGIFKANTVLSDSEVTLAETMFILNSPQMWKYVQMRLNSRKLANIVIKLSFNDGYEVKAPSNNISLGGVSFFCREKIPSIYTKLPCKLTMVLPGLDPGIFPNQEFTVTARFVREKERADDFHPFDILYVFKFVGMNSIEEELLEHCLSLLK